VNPDRIVIGVLVAVIILVLMTAGICLWWGYSFFVVAVNRALTDGKLAILRNPPKPGTLITMDEFTQRTLNIKDFVEFRVVYPEDKAEQAETLPIVTNIKRPNKRPSELTIKRFEVLNRLKAAHPDWTQSKLGTEAYKELGEMLSEDDVRNVYREKGVEWPRGKRIR